MTIYMIIVYDYNILPDILMLLFIKSNFKKKLDHRFGRPMLKDHMSGITISLQEDIPQLV